MEAVVSFACEHAHSAHWIFFLLLMLAGLNIPVSEDILLLTAGALAATCIPEETFHLFGWMYIGCWVSAWEAYWLGRQFGPKLYNIAWFHRFINPKKIERLHYYYEKFGVFTFIVGRFCPGGVRNALFLSAGLGKMPFLTFILRDGFAACISVSTIFYIGYRLGENYRTIVHYIQEYNMVAFAIIVTFVVALIGYLAWKSKRKNVM